MDLDTGKVRTAVTAKVLSVGDNLSVVFPVSVTQVLKCSHTLVLSTTSGHLVLQISLSGFSVNDLRANDSSVDLTLDVTRGCRWIHQLPAFAWGHERFVAHTLLAVAPAFETPVTKVALATMQLEEFFALGTQALAAADVAFMDSRWGFPCFSIGRDSLLGAVVGGQGLDPILRRVNEQLVYWKMTPPPRRPASDLLLAVTAPVFCKCDFCTHAAPYPRLADSCCHVPWGHLRNAEFRLDMMFAYACLIHHHQRETLAAPVYHYTQCGPVLAIGDEHLVPRGRASDFVQKRPCVVMSVTWTPLQVTYTVHAADRDMDRRVALTPDILHWCRTSSGVVTGTNHKFAPDHHRTYTVDQVYGAAAGDIYVSRSPLVTL